MFYLDSLLSALNEYLVRTLDVVLYVYASVHSCVTRKNMNPIVQSNAFENVKDLLCFKVIMLSYYSNLKRFSL